EHRDETAGMLAHVVLPLEPRAAAEREVASLAAETPQHASRVPVELVRRPGVARRHDEMTAGRNVDRGDVEVVQPRARPGLDRGPGDGKVIEAVPLPEQAPARQRKLLHHAADDPTVLAPRLDLVRRHECRVPRRDLELVEVTVSAEACDLAVRRVDDDPLAVA